MGRPGRIKGELGTKTAEDLCLGFGCRGKGFFAKVSICFHSSNLISVFILNVYEIEGTAYGLLWVAK